MKNQALALCALAMVAGCDMFKKDKATTDNTSSASSDASTAPTSTSASIVDKALSFLGGGGPFEGEVTMTDTSAIDHTRGVANATGAMNTTTITYDVKGDKMRFNAPGSGGESGYVIFDVPTKTMTAISDTKKTAMVMSLDSGPMAAKAAALPKATVEKSSGTDTVAGYSCDVYKITEANGDKSEACLAKGIRFPQLGRGEASWIGDIGDGNVFPMRVVTTDAAGKEKNRMQVTKVDKKTLDPAMFTVPAGYKTMNMEDMMKSLGGMGGGMPHR